jgi:general secretion pathway protein D
LRLALKFAKAPTVANSINILFARQGSPQLRGGPQPGQPQPNQPQQQQQSSSTTRTGFYLQQEAKEEGYYPWLGGQPDAAARPGETRSGVRPVSDLVGRVRAVADQRANAVLISANVHLLPQVLKLIEDLDQPTDQVLIEARLVEVATDYMDRLGVRWSPDGSQVFTAEDMDNSILATANARYLQGFGGKTEVNTPTVGNLAQAITTLKSGVLDSTINMDFLIQFLRKTTDASVLAEPQLNIRDNETGRLFVGQEVPIPDNQQAYQGTQNTTFRYKQVGIVLEVTPHINSAGDIELTIHAEASTVVQGQTILGGAIFDTRNFRTDVRAKDGQTLVLGGIIQRLLNDTLRKTPGLGSIPGLGWAFKKKDKTTKAVELMVFLRPKVVRTADDAYRLLDDLDKRAPLIKKFKDEMQSGDTPRDPALTPSRPLEPLEPGKL